MSMGPEIIPALVSEVPRNDFELERLLRSAVTRWNDSPETKSAIEPLVECLGKGQIRIATVLDAIDAKWRDSPPAQKLLERVSSIAADAENSQRESATQVLQVLKNK